jgi:hypothetical protein
MVKPTYFVFYRLVLLPYPMSDSPATLLHSASWQLALALRYTEQVSCFALNARLNTLRLADAAYHVSEGSGTKPSSTLPLFVGSPAGFPNTPLTEFTPGV